MTTKSILALAASCALLLLAACGGSDDGVPLGPFPALSKTEGDPPFKLTAPTSKSPGAFSYESSDQKVATIQGDMVTIVAVAAGATHWPLSYTSGSVQLRFATVSTALVEVGL